MLCADGYSGWLEIGNRAPSGASRRFGKLYAAGHDQTSARHGKVLGAYHVVDELVAGIHEVLDELCVEFVIRVPRSSCQGHRWF